MKAKQQKYQEAVERNLRRIKKSKYLGYDLAKLRIRMGIRKADRSHDAFLLAISNGNLQ